MNNQSNNNLNISITHVSCVNTFHIDVMYGEYVTGYVCMDSIEDLIKLRDEIDAFIKGHDAKEDR